MLRGVCGRGESASYQPLAVTKRCISSDSWCRSISIPNKNQSPVYLERTGFTQTADPTRLSR